MKKLAILTALAATSLGLAACTGHKDGDNAALANDATLNESDFTTDQNLTVPETGNGGDAAAGVDANASATDAPLGNETATNAL